MSKDSGSRREGDDAPVASRYIKALLNRHDIASNQHTITIADVLGVKYTMAYRRLNGTVAWEVEEIETIAKHFGESLATVFSEQHVSEEVTGVLVAGPVRVPCQLIPGHLLRDPVRNSLVAVRLGEQWMVMPVTDAGMAECFEVVSMRVVGVGDRRWRIAVLDDDADESKSLAKHFSARGCEVEAFTRVEALIPSMRLKPFDGFVIDWMLAEGSAAELVGMIRADDRDCGNPAAAQGRADQNGPGTLLDIG